MKNLEKREVRSYNKVR